MTALTRLRRSALLGLLLVLGAWACGESAADRERERQRLAQEDALALAPDIYDVVDRVAAYRESVGRSPRTLRQAGIDSLTPTTARWIDTRDGLGVMVSFRRTEGHILSRCRGTEMVLEDVALEGLMRLECLGDDGNTQTMTVPWVSR